MNAPEDVTSEDTGTEDTGTETLADELGRMVQRTGLCGGDGQLSCEEAAELLHTYLDELAASRGVDGEPGDVTVVRMREHLGLCPPCENEFAVYERISVSLSRCRSSVPPETKQRLERFCIDLCNGEHDGV